MSGRGFQGRKPRGALPGESKDQRDARVAQFAMDNPSMDVWILQRTLDIPFALALDVCKTRARSGKVKKIPQFIPPQQFTPGPPMPETAQERMDAVSDEDRADIEARHGAKFPDREP